MSELLVGWPAFKHPNLYQVSVKTNVVKVRRLTRFMRNFT